jgi:hypothetical protein
MVHGWIGFDEKRCKYNAIVLIVTLRSYIPEWFIAITAYDPQKTDRKKYELPLLRQIPEEDP